MNTEYNRLNTTVFPTALGQIQEGRTDSALKFLDKQYESYWHNLSEMDSAREAGKQIFQFEFKHFGIARAIHVLKAYQENGQFKNAVPRFIAQHYQQINDPTTAEKISYLMLSPIRREDIPRLEL